MKIVILGGGLTGLTAAFYLSKNNNEVVIVEKGERLGGLAGGFREKHWSWDLERTYHHIFSNDTAILQLAQEIKFSSFSFSSPITASLFGSINNYRIFPVDSPKNLLTLPELSFISKVRAGVVVLFLKLSPFFSWYEKITSSRFLQKTMGGEVWKSLWEQLLVKKYGKYAEKILASFIWARIKKRTRQLGYPVGGFQAFVDAVGKADTNQGVKIATGFTVQSVNKKGASYEVNTKNIAGELHTFPADIVISTMPYPITCTIMGNLLGEAYVKEQGKRKYLSAINLIIKTKKPVLKNTYWLNVGAADIPIMCIVQHTNFISPKEYGGDNICYLAWYVDSDSELLKKDKQEMVEFVLPYIKRITQNESEVPEVVGLFKAPYAQPIFDSEFAKIPRTFSTPDKNIYVANMDMTYPYDRGTNYAVQLGKDVSSYILQLL